MLSAGIIQIRSLIRQFIRNETAATMVEYALMVALIAIVCIVAVKAIGLNASGKFQDAAAAIENP